MIVPGHVHVQNRIQRMPAFKVCWQLPVLEVAKPLFGARQCRCLSRLSLGNKFVVTERALLQWIHAFNASGIDGLIVKNRTGRPRKIEKEPAAAFVDLLEHPEPADRTHGTVKSLHG